MSAVEHLLLDRFVNRPPHPDLAEPWQRFIIDHTPAEQATELPPRPYRGRGRPARPKSMPTTLKRTTDADPGKHRQAVHGRIVRLLSFCRDMDHEGIDQRGARLAYGLSQRQFFRDLATIRAAGVPVVRQGKVYVIDRGEPLPVVKYAPVVEAKPEPIHEPIPEPEAHDTAKLGVDLNVLHLLPCLPITAKASHIAVDLGITVEQVIDAVERLGEHQIIEMAGGDSDPEVGLWEESYRDVVNAQRIGGAA
ncbi:hypothetical protein ACERK3_02210 [Phycisphaerales bacterium AB-hyl4]|uniref:Transcriptional regulator n=1 Tax=Natronomicrosphaera hydrolytica TaxID=3242702 RepID=A0ABV4U3Q3_9BACT